MNNTNLQQFALAMRRANNELRAAGRVNEDDFSRVSQALSNPVVIGRNGERIFVLRRLRAKARRLYARQYGITLEIDWEAIVEWLKENWDEILKLVISIAIFVI